MTSLLQTPTLNPKHNFSGRRFATHSECPHRFATRCSSIVSNAKNSITYATRYAYGSGCGKSTCAALLERFYDPDGGSVRLGGADVRDLPLEGLRSRVAFVGQEPKLFDFTIGERQRVANR